MNKFLLAVVSLTVLLICGLSLAQDIYVYPNKKLADPACGGLIEYRRYTLEEARSYQQGGSFEPYLTTAWSSEQRLTTDSNVYSPKAITYGDSIFCSYFSFIEYLPYYISSYNQGIDWNRRICLADTSYTFSYSNPELAKYGSNILMVSSIYNFQSQGFNLAYRKSVDNGLTWASLHSILPYYRLHQSEYSSMGFSGRTIFSSYVDYDHDSIYVVKSTDFGTSWNDRGTNVSFLSGTPQPMTVRASDSIIHLAWVNEILPVSVRYSRSTDAGQTWSPEIDIAQDPYGAQWCYVSVQDTHVVISWMGYKYSPYAFTGDLFIKQSFAGGATWDTAQGLTDLHKVMFSNVYIKDSLIVIAWMDDRYENNNDEVMARYSTDYGTTWSEETRLSFGDYHSDSPMAFSTGNRIHILWGDRREANPGLYYCYNDLFMGIDDLGLPTESSLLSAYPNPFNSSVILRCNDKENKTIAIYNIAGQLVKTLYNDGKEVKVIWNGTDDDGQPLSSGIYLVVAKTSLGMQHLKVTFLK